MNETTSKTKRLQYVDIARGTIGVNEIPTFDGLDISDPISYLNNIDISSLDIEDDKYFIYHNYSPNSKYNKI